MANDIFRRRLGGTADSGLTLNRRGFLISAFASGVAFGFPAASKAAMDPAAADGLPVAADGTPFAPTIWYWIDDKGKVNVHIIRAEMGQHVGTAIARILADELGANWDDVSIEHVDTDPKWGLMVTGGSWSVWQSWPVYRQAGAAGRVALAEKAAALWGVDVAEVTVADGQVTAPGHSAGFGELVAGGIDRSFTADELKALPLKPVSDLTLVGKDVTALDIPNKTTGQTIFGIDAKIDGMVYAAPILPPTRYGSEITAIDDSAARLVKGYRQTLKIDDPSGTAPGWAMVIADSQWAAWKAADKVKVSWAAGPAATLGEADFQAKSRELIADESVGALLDTGNADVDPVFATAADTFEAEYDTATVLHFQLEPLNATVFRNAEGIWEVHTGNQWQSLCLPWIQQALGVGDGEVIMRTYMLGGGFGRRLNGDYAIPVALASKALDGKPVKMVMKREDDARFDSPRSPSVSKIRMAFDADKKVVAMDSAVASGWPTKVMIPGFMPKGTNGEPYDPFASDGVDHWYEVGAQRARAISNELARGRLPPGLAALGLAGVESTSRWKASWTRRRIMSVPIRCSSGWITSPPKAATPAARRIPSAAPSVRPRPCAGWPRSRAMAALICPPILPSASPPPMVSRAACPPGSAVPRRCMSIARPAGSRCKSFGSRSIAASRSIPTGRGRRSRVARSGVCRWRSTRGRSSRPARFATATSTAIPRSG